jgi:uncharacterized membrane protein
MRNSKYLLVLILVVGLLVPLTQDAQAGTDFQSQDGPVVRVIMFWMSTCGHCEYVINDVLPPLQEQYGDQLEILLIELVTQEDVDTLYETAAILGIPPNNVGVPFMLVGEQVLRGSQQIPSELPGLIETHLASGGLDYPSFPLLEGYLPEEVEEPDSGNDVAQGEAQSAGPAADSISNGFTIAYIVLIGMGLAIIITIYALVRNREPGSTRRNAWLDWLVPVVALVGIGVAGYLTYVETQAVVAICGPVGDCNAVQNSPYAKILGILPVGIFGLVGYVAILIAWVIQKVNHGRWASYAQLAMLGMAFFGTLYSVYLTYLEIWVIRAVCMWCISSAVLITLLMLLSIQPAIEALDSLSEEE